MSERSKIFLSVDRRGIDGRLQLSIDCEDFGYRIAGPKYDGKGTNLLRHEITARDIREIESFLKKARAALGASTP